MANQIARGSVSEADWVDGANCSRPTSSRYKAGEFVCHFHCAMAKLLAAKSTKTRKTSSVRQLTKACQSLNIHSASARLCSPSQSISSDPIEVEDPPNNRDDDLIESDSGSV